MLQLRSYLDGMINKDTAIYYEDSFSTDQEYLYVKININELFREFSSNYGRKFKVFIVFNNRLYNLTNINPKHTFYINNTNISCFTEETLILETSSSKDITIPLAIMGSCFSRAAFNSAEYFNPDYKEHFNVSYSYFWPSMISLVSNPLPYDKKMFNDVPEGKLFEIEWEFLKNWDKSLKSSGAEYLLLDFFVDAMHGVLQFGENQFLTRNLYTRNTEYYHSTLLKEGKSLDSYHPEYFNLWKVSFDLFIERIKDIIPKENIILNLSFLTDKYHDENGCISSFFNTKHITRPHFLHVNNMWTKMNNYFLTKLPKAKVLDMNRFKYISQYDSPKDLAPCGPHHFESGYYKSIIYRVKQGNNKVINSSHSYCF